MYSLYCSSTLTHMTVLAINLTSLSKLVSFSKLFLIRSIVTLNMSTGHYHIQRNETAQNLIRMVQMTLTEVEQFKEKI